MILKAGTYKFNSVLTTNSIQQLLPRVTITAELNGISETIENVIVFVYGNRTIDDNDYMVLEVGQDGSQYGTPLYISPSLDVYTPWIGGATVYITLTEWNNYTDNFITWFIANTNYNEVNTKPLAEITYNGETIAQLNAEETATLSCEGKKMASDVVFKVNKVESKIPEGYVKPEGTLEITVNNVEAEYPIDCSQYAKVAVNTAEPLRISDPTVLDNITDSPWAVGGNVFLYEGTTTDSYENGVYYLLEDTDK